MRRYLTFLLLISFAFFFSPSSLRAQTVYARELNAQEYRDRMKIPSLTIYETMLNFAGKEDYEKVSKSLLFVREILEMLKIKFEVDLEKELKTVLEKKNKEIILTTIRKLIFYDMEDLFRILLVSKDVPTTRLRTFIRTGYLDYLLLSPKIKEKEFKTDLALKKIFQRVFFLMGTTSPYAVEEKIPEKEEKPVTIDWEAIRKELSVVEKEILRLFPEFKLPEKKEK